MAEHTPPGLGQAGRVISAIIGIAAFIGGFILMGSAFDGHEHSAWIFTGGLFLCCFVVFAGMQMAGSRDEDPNDTSV